MEIESKNGSKIRLQQNTDFGRGLLGFDSTDRTVSRHHISFKTNKKGTTVLFQVKGKNPIWVRDSNTHEIRVYKTSERGELNIGDSFCVSAKNPVWFNLKRITTSEEENNDNDNDNEYDETDGGIRYDEAFAEISGADRNEIEIQSGDISDIDPVKEFDFVVMGHEFDCYSKKLIHDIKKWNWFLEEPDKDSDEEDDTDERKLRKGGRKKRKKSGRGDDDDDDVWTGESEEDVEVIKKSRNDMKPKYSTRSKDKNKKGASKSAKDNAKRKATSDDDDYDDEEEEDEEDETLGGFVVDDEDIGEGDEEDDEEEEFEEDEDDE